MSRHTTLEVGGPADVFVEPADREEMQDVAWLLKELELPTLVLGGGANLVVADAGVRGVVLSTKGLNRLESESTRTVRIEAGASISDAAEHTARNNRAGLEFLYSMPGSVGGAVWMNARCYGSSVSDVLLDVDYLDENRKPQKLRACDHTFAYKQTPFQNRDTIILGCRFQLYPERLQVLEARMEQYRADREQKGHFTAPSAGSMFKNNRAFGRPTGQLIDELGLRGTQIGGARISDLHANIIINAGGASAADIDALASLVERRVAEHFGFTLEREVRFVGAWESTTSSKHN